MGSKALDSYKNLAGKLFDSFDSVLESRRGARPRGPWACDGSAACLPACQLSSGSRAPPGRRKGRRDWASVLGGVSRPGLPSAGGQGRQGQPLLGP